jgi:hypothetical protein
MTDQLSPDLQWAFLQQFQQQQQQLQQQQDQRQNGNHNQQQQTNGPNCNLNMDFTSNFQASSASTIIPPNTQSNQNINNGNLDSQLWNLYQNYNSSASNSGNMNASAMTSSTASSFTDSGGMMVPTGRMELSSNNTNLSQSRAMLAQYQQMQMFTNSHLGASSSVNMGGHTQTTTTAASNPHGQLMLQSKVEPFQRGHSSTNDDDVADLWKVFDDEVSCLSIHLDDRLARIHNCLI